MIRVLTRWKTYFSIWYNVQSMRGGKKIQSDWNLVQRKHCRRWNAALHITLHGVPFLSLKELLLSLKELLQCLETALLFPTTLVSHFTDLQTGLSSLFSQYISWGCGKHGSLQFWNIEKSYFLPKFQRLVVILIFITIIIHLFSFVGTIGHRYFWG